MIASAWWAPATGLPSAYRITSTGPAGGADQLVSGSRNIGTTPFRTPSPVRTTGDCSAPTYRVSVPCGTPPAGSSRSGEPGDPLPGLTARSARRLTSIVFVIRHCQSSPAATVTVSGPGPVSGLAGFVSSVQLISAV
ncbi:MAG: hypothetical protein U0R69_04180 [Gaiellales bacterium]